MKMKNPVAFFRFMLFFLLIGAQYRCASIALDPLYQGPFPLPKRIDNEFAYPKEWTAEIERKESYRQVRILLANGSTDKSPIRMDYYPCVKPGKHPAILVSPILGGQNHVATHFARFLSDHGFHCLVVHRPNDLTKNLKRAKLLDARLKKAVIRDRIALDWLCQQPEVLQDRIGGFGISYGGIKNSILAGVDKRLQANVFALAGGDLASVITHSTMDKLQELTESTCQSQGMLREQAEKGIRDEIRMDPLRFAPYIDPHKTLLILACFDKTVPKKNGEMLRKSLGYPKTIYLPTGHYSAALFTGIIGFPYIEQEVLRFFKRKLTY